MAVSYTKKGKLLFIVQEFEKRNDRYNINGIDRERAKYFARTHQGQFNEIPLGNYRIAEQSNQVYLLITNQEYLATIERLQICYEFASISSDYEVEFDVNINTLKDKYNQLVTDVKNLFKYVKTNMMTADSLDVFNILPQLDADEVWVKTVDGWRGLNIGNLEANIAGLIAEMKSMYNKYMGDIRRLGDGYEKDISHMGNTFKREMTEIKNSNYSEVNALGMQYKTQIQAMGETYLSNIADSFKMEVMQGKEDINTHTTEKLEVLDSTTAIKVQEVENKKRVALGEIDSHTGAKKVELQLYEQELENQLKEYPVMKTQELDNYVTGTIIPSIDLHTATKIDALDDHVMLKKEDLDTYEKTKEVELDTYNKTNIGKYDTEIREGLSTYQMFLVNQMDTHAQQTTQPKVNAIVQAGVESARSQVDGEVAKVREEGNKQLQLVASEGSRQTGLVSAEGDAQIKRIQETSLDGKQDKEDLLLQTDSKNVVGAINELKNKKLDATGGLVSGELDFNTGGDNALRFLSNGDPKGYIFPTTKGLRITGTNLKTDGITITNNGDNVILEKGAIVRNRLKIKDFLETEDYADIVYSAKSDEQPLKTLVLGNVEHLVIGDRGGYYKVYSQKNFDPNSKFNVTGGELQGNLTIKQDGIKSLNFLDNANNEYGAITCDGGNGNMYITNKRSNKGISMDVSGNTTIDAKNLQTSSKEVVGAINELKETKLNKTASSLQTSSKSVVDAINEVNRNKQSVNDNRLNTVAKDIVGAINEVNSKGIDTSTLVKKSGDTMTGGLTVNGNIATGSNGNVFQAYHNYGYMCGADSSNTQKYAMYGYNNVLNIGYSGWNEIRANNKLTVGGNEVWHSGNLNLNGFWSNSNNPISKAQNGYCKLANGLIIQWGKNSQSTNNWQRTSFPTSFSNTNYSITVTATAPGDVAGQPTMTIRNNRKYASSIEWYIPGGTGWFAHWIAIGY